MQRAYDQDHAPNFYDQQLTKSTPHNIRVESSNAQPETNALHIIAHQSLLPNGIIFIPHQPSICQEKLPPTCSSQKPHRQTSPALHAVVRQFCASYPATGSHYVGKYGDNLSHRWSIRPQQRPQLESRLNYNERHLSTFQTWYHPYRLNAAKITSRWCQWESVNEACRQPQKRTQ